MLGTELVSFVSLSDASCSPACMAQGTVKLTWSVYFWITDCIARGGGLKVKSNIAIQPHPSTNTMDSSITHVEVPSGNTQSTCSSTDQPLLPNSRNINVVKTEIQSSSSHQPHPSRAVGPTPRDTSSFNVPEHARLQKSQSNYIHQSKQSPKSDKVSTSL